MIKGMGLKHFKPFKLGDTLVEVSIAIGIFSMVAIATVSVINASTSSTQGMLENTITREEIDAQAEALRYIQSAYVSGGENDPLDTSPDTKYSRLWNKILKYHTLDISDSSSLSSEIKSLIANYNPTACKPLYDSKNTINLINQKAFIINTRAMASNNIDDILIEPTSSNLGKTTFRESSTFPRIVYNQTVGGDNAIYNQGEDSNIANGTAFGLNSAEGLYIVAVKDSNGTVIVSDENGKIEKKSAFVDFYIRSCWFAPSSDRPSTISTVIRLYNPEAIAINKYQKRGIIIKYDGNGATDGTMPLQYIISGSKAKLLDNRFSRNDYTFMGWNTKPDGSGTQYPSTGGVYTAANNLTENKEVTLYAQWKEYTVMIKPGGGIASITLNNKKCTDAVNGCSVSLIYGKTYNLSAEVKDGFVFTNWSKSNNNNTGTIGNVNNINTTYIIGDNPTVITAGWKYKYTLTYYDTNGSTVLCSEQFTTTDTSHIFTINGCSGKTPTNPDPSKYVFQGWSEDKIEGREPLYNKGGVDGTNGSIKATVSPAHQNISLYPVWRVVITFSDTKWTEDGGNVAPDCTIFNVNKPANGSSTAVTAGSSYGSYNTAPMNGYIVYSGGKNVELFQNGVNLQGYCYRAANVGVYYEIGKDDTFELSAKMNTMGMRTHPGGYVDVSIGPLHAQINNGSVTATCQSSSNTGSFSANSIITLKLSKYGNDYSMSLNGNVLKTCTVANYSDGNNKIRVKYYMIHYDHGCSEIFNVQLTDIKMKQVIKE